MTAELYCFGESGNAYKAALTMQLAGYDWRPVFVDFFNGAARAPDFRALNEMGEVPVVEVHISNVHRREAFRHTSFVSPQATAVIAGAGILGYEFGVDVVAQHLGLR